MRIIETVYVGVTVDTEEHQIEQCWVRDIGIPSVIIAVTEAADPDHLLGQHVRKDNPHIKINGQNIEDFFRTGVREYPVEEIMVGDEDLLPNEWHFRFRTREESLDESTRAELFELADPDYLTPLRRLEALERDDRPKASGIRIATLA